MDTRPGLMPKARKDRLIIKELPDETLVYDVDTDKAHCLNETAAAVWKNCDGENSVAEINSALSKASGVAVDQRVVWLALDQLEKIKLLERAPTSPEAFGGLNRRQLMQSLGVAAIALPVVTSIVSPTPAMAVSVCNVPNSCSPTNPCTNPACSSCNPGNGRCQ